MKGERLFLLNPVYEPTAQDLNFFPSPFILVAVTIHSLIREHKLLYTLFATTVFSTKVGNLWEAYSFAFLKRGCVILSNNYIKKANTQQWRVWQGLHRKEEQAFSQLKASPVAHSRAEL